MIKYGDKEFRTRDITICPNDMAMTVTVAERELWTAIKQAVMAGCKYETMIDSKIMYYCDEEQWNMSDEELARFLENI